MRFIKYLLIAVFLFAGCTSVFGQDEFTPEKVREMIRLAEQGDAEAQSSLGWMYKDGEGVPQDYQLAAKWYRRAAKQGDASAQFNLGVMYFKGEGVPQDSQEAVKWYRRAAEQGHKNAAELRDVLATEMNTSKIQEAQKLAREFKPKKEKP